MTNDTFGIKPSFLRIKSELRLTQICSTLSASENHNYKTQRFSLGYIVGHLR